MKILALFALTIGMAQAQDTTLIYRGLNMTGTETTLSSTTGMVLASNEYEANFYAQLDISGSLAAHDLRLISEEVNCAQFILDLPSPLLGQGGPDFRRLGGWIDLTTKNGQITGAAIAISGTALGILEYTANIAPPEIPLTMWLGMVVVRFVLRIVPAASAFSRLRIRAPGHLDGDDNFGSRDRSILRRK